LKDISRRQTIEIFFLEVFISMSNSRDGEQLKYHLLIMLSLSQGTYHHSRIVKSKKYIIHIQLVRMFQFT
jgi:hypothetical protein